MMNWTDKLQRVKSHLIDSAKIQQMVADNCIDDIMEASKLISTCFDHGNKILLCGNGGSAADCQHMATEFVSQLTPDFKRQGLPAIALTTDTSFITAYANDYDFSGIFERQVTALGKSGDVLIGISTSGNSINIIKAFKAAINNGVGTVLLTGSGGKLKDIASISICVPSNNTQYIQESHLTIEHIICDLVERQISI